MPNNPERSRARRVIIPLALAGIGLALAPVFANDWPELRGDSTRRGVSSEKVAPPLSLLWRFTAGAQTLNSNGPIIVGNTVYFAARATADLNSGGVLYALDSRTGAQKWQYPKVSDGNGLPGRHNFRTAPLVSDGRVYIGASDGSLYILNADTGEYILQLRTGRAIESAPTIVDGTLYFGSNDGTFYALDPNTGQPVWRQVYRPGDSVNSAPIVAAGFTFFSTVDNSIHAVKEKSGVFAWKARMPYRVLANAPIYADNNLFVPAGPRLFAMQPTSGATRWQQNLPGDILVAPAADNNIVYAICRDERTTGSLVYAFRSNNGRVAWEKPAALPLTPAAAPTISGNVMYIPTNRNMIIALSLDDGKILWEYYVEPSSNRPSFFAPTQNTSITAPISVANGAVYCLADDGSLLAFRPDAVDSTGPMFFGLYPPVGSAVNGQPPLTVAAYAMDAGSGLNPESVEMTVDNKKVESDFDPSRNLIYYRTRSTGKIVDPPLSNGVHSATITALDWRGNKTEQKWEFRVNNALPKPAPTEAPAPSSRPRPGIGGNNTGGNTTGQPGGNRNPGQGGNPGGTRGGNRGGGRP